MSPCDEGRNVAVELAHPYSAAMLCPGPRVVQLVGLRVKVLEFRVDDVAEVERTLMRLAGHPTSILAERQAAIDAAKARYADREKSDPERQAAIDAAIRAYIVAQDAWPPRFGSVLASRLLATWEGATAYVWQALSRNHPRLSRRQSDAICSAMTMDDWHRLDAAAWGRLDDEVGEPEPDDPKKRAGYRLKRAEARGWDWGATYRTLLVDFGMTMAEIGRLHVSQVRFLLAMEPTGKVRQTAWVAGPTPSEGGRASPVTSPPPDTPTSPDSTTGAGDLP